MTDTNKKWTLAALFLGLLEVMFIDAMSSIVGPAIVSDLGDTSLYAFMYTLTFLCNTLALPITSMIGNKSGRKYVIVAGVILYGVSTVLAGMAGNMMLHVILRGLQGIGKGCILGNALAYFGESLDEQGRAKAMGFYGNRYRIRCGTSCRWCDRKCSRMAYDLLSLHPADSDRVGCPAFQNAAGKACHKRCQAGLARNP